MVAAFGLLIVTAVVGGVLGRYNRLPSRGAEPLPLHSLGNQPILHIELPRDEDDLRAVFLAGDRAANVRDVRIGNRIDSLWFIPAYSGLLAAIGIMLRRHSAPSFRAAVLGALLLLPLIAVSDWVENSGIGQTLDHVETAGTPDAGDAARIAYPSLAKWLLLSIVLLVYGVAAVVKPPMWRRGTGVLLLALDGLLAVTLARYALERWGS